MLTDRKERGLCIQGLNHEGRGRQEEADEWKRRSRSGEKIECPFLADINEGQRAAYIFFEMKDASKIPAIAEPRFLAFNASVEIHPVMVLVDL